MIGVGVGVCVVFCLQFHFQMYQRSWWFNSKIHPWMSSMTSWCIPLQGAGVHVAECIKASYNIGYVVPTDERMRYAHNFTKGKLGLNI